MKVWIEIAKDKNKPCYVFQNKPKNRGFDFGFEEGTSGRILQYHPSKDKNIISYLRGITIKLQWIELSESSFLYEVDLDD